MTPTEASTLLNEAARIIRAMPEGCKVGNVNVSPYNDPNPIIHIHADCADALAVLRSMGATSEDCYRMASGVLVWSPLEDARVFLNSPGAPVDPVVRL